MIEMKILEMSELKPYIMMDFNGLIDDLEGDIDESMSYSPVCYTWFLDDKIIGYMCTIYVPEFTFCSYTKMYDRVLYRTMYRQFKEIYTRSTEEGLPVVTDGTNFMHCKNHVIQYKDTELFQWKLK